MKLLDSINIALLLIMVALFVCLIKYVVKLSKLETEKKESFNISSFKDIVFFNRRVIKKMENKDEQWLDDVRKLVFKVKATLILYVISLCSIFVITIIILSKCYNAEILYKHFPVLAWDFLLIMIFIIEPASSVINHKLKNKVDQLIHFILNELPKILAAQLIDFMVFFIFIISILFINHYTNKVLINYFSLYKEHIDFSLGVWVFSILFYQSLITPIINIIIKRLKLASIISESYNVKIRTYLHIIFIYAFFKLAKFSGDSDVEKYFSVQFEAITIFFMIDVYFDKKKTARDSIQEKLKIETQEEIKKIKSDIENLKKINKENIEEISNKVDTSYKNLEIRMQSIENLKTSKFKEYISSIFKKLA